MHLSTRFCGPLPELLGQRIHLSIAKTASFEYEAVFVLYINATANGVASSETCSRDCPIREYQIELLIASINKKLLRRAAFSIDPGYGRRAAGIIVPSCVAKPSSRRVFYRVICRLVLPYFHYSMKRPRLLGV